MDKATNVTIDGKEYALADLSKEASQQLANLNAVDAEIRHLKQQLAIAQTARGTIGNNCGRNKKRGQTPLRPLYKYKEAALRELAMVHFP